VAYRLFLAAMLLLLSVNASALLNPGPDPAAAQRPRTPFTVQAWNVKGDLMGKLDEAKSLCQRVQHGITFLIDHQLSKTETRYDTVRSHLAGRAGGPHRAGLFFSAQPKTVPKQQRRGICAVVPHAWRQLCTRRDEPAHLEGSVLTLDLHHSRGGGVFLRIIGVYLRPWDKMSDKQAQAYINAEAQLCRASLRAGGSPYHLLIVGDFNATYHPEDRPGNRVYSSDRKWQKFCKTRARISPVLKGAPAHATSFVSDSDASRQSQIDNCYALQHTHRQLAPTGRVAAGFEHSSDHDACVFEFDLAAAGASLPAVPSREQPQPQPTPAKAIKTPIKPTKLAEYTERCTRQLLPAILAAQDAVRAAWAAGPGAPPPPSDDGEADALPPPPTAPADLVGAAIEQISALDGAFFDTAAEILPHSLGTPPLGRRGPRAPSAHR